MQSLNDLWFGIAKHKAKTAKYIFVCFSSLYTVVKIITQFFPSFQISGIAPLVAGLLISIGWGLWRVWKPSKTSLRISNTNVTIEIIFADIFAQDGVRAIGVSEFFETEIGTPVSDKSLHGMFLRRHFSGYQESIDIYKRGRIWWYTFRWRGEEIRESTKQANKRVAERIEAAHKTRLAEGLVGIFEKIPAPSLREFATNRFLTFVEQTFAAKRKTGEFYKQGVKKLLANSALADCRITEITAEMISEHAGRERSSGLEISSVNRQLQVLRRIFVLSMEWKAVDKLLPKVKLLPGENRRERVLTAVEDARYITATEQVGKEIVANYQRALSGIRAILRSQKPIHPRDPYVMRDIATVLLDCGLRPDECFRARRDT